MVTSAALDRTNLHTQVFWNLFNLINSRSNVVDPVNSSGTRKFVYSHEPVVDSRGFAGYPLVAVYPATVNVNGMMMGSGKVREITGEIIIEVRSTDTHFRGPNATDSHGKGLTYLDAISDDIMETLNSSSNRATLCGNNIGMIEIEGGSVDFIPVGDEMIYVREFRITFNTKLLTVSA